MLLRNLDPPRLCNGTRLTVKRMMPHVIEARMIGGKFSGEFVFIPHIPLAPSDSSTSEQSRVCGVHPRTSNNLGEGP